MLEISDKYKFNLEEPWFIGDGVNDIECFKLVGLPIAYNPREKEVNKHAKVIYDFRELNRIL